MFYVGGQPLHIGDGNSVVAELALRTRGIVAVLMSVCEWIACAMHVSVRVAPVRGILSHGDPWELRLLKFFIMMIIIMMIIIIVNWWSFACCDVLSFSK